MAKSYWKALTETAKAVRSPDTPNVPGLPRNDPPTFQTAEVTAVDLGRKVLGLKFNDPSGAEVTTGIPWLRTFTDDKPPATGDQVKLIYTGGQLQAFGVQEVADDTVTFD